MLNKLEKYDHFLMLTVIALTCFGVVMVFSASAVMADKRYHDAFYFLKRQGGFAAAGFLLMYATMKIDYHFWQKYAVVALVASLVLLVIVFTDL